MSTTSSPPAESSRLTKSGAGATAAKRATLQSGESAERGREVDWTHIAVDCGYFDQAHFIHDFRSFGGITPTGYDAGRTQFRNHVHFLQADAAAGMR